MENYPLKNAVAVVTGASSGIGEAVALELAQLGINVALIARRKERLDNLVSRITAAGGKAMAFEADITDRNQAEKAVQEVITLYSKIDILVNNAGLMLLGNVSQTDPEQWNRMISINVQGLLYMTKAALPHLTLAAKNSPRKVADIINISSVAAFQFNEINSTYAMTKAAVNAFTESLRQEVSKKEHVRVGIVEPGSVATELASHNTQEIQDGILSPYFNEIETLLPVDIAQAISYMITRPARASVNKLWIGPTEQI